MEVSGIPKDASFNIFDHVAKLFILKVINYLLDQPLGLSASSVFANYNLVFNCEKRYRLRRMPMIVHISPNSPNSPSINNDASSVAAQCNIELNALLAEIKAKLVAESSASALPLAASASAAA
jgi:hypothetical protein